jgi:hypothetical protein
VQLDDLNKKKEEETNEPEIDQDQTLNNKINN